MSAAADSVVAGWLPEGGQIRLSESRTRERRILRRILLCGAAGTLLAPFVLAPFFGPAVAMPAGAGVALAGSLFGAVGVSSAMRRLAGRGQEDEASSATDNTALQFDGRFFAGLVTVHDVQGDVTSVSGRDAAEYLKKIRNPLGKGFIEQIHVSDRINFLRAVDELRLGAENAAAELRLAFLEGGRENQFLNFRVNMTAMRGEDGKFAGFVAQSVDNGDLVAARREVAAHKNEAESANEAKSRFLAAVSHELRTPLNAILGFSDILAGEYFGKLENDRQREYVGLISQSGNHLLSVVNTMLDMSKIEAGHYELMTEPFPIDEVAHGCEAMLDIQAQQKKVTLTSRVTRNSGEVVADLRALKQIVINLVGNAIKFTDEGGVVSVDYSVRDKMLEIVVSDTGIGIPADKIELLGKPFMQVQNEYSRKYEGTGLGLSLVKGLVALHGGTFAISSETGEGTVITVRLPADGSGADRVREAGLDGSMVEFPPRLGQAPASEKEKTEVKYDAEAQSA